MAKMWPEKIPAWVLQDKRRSSEAKVFNALEAALEDEWNVYYSRPWYGLTKSGGEVEGEADFIIAHPKKGILFIEVKGGQISYDPNKSQWYSTDRNNIKHKIKDPVDQAKKCRYEFAKKLDKNVNWPKHFVNFKYGVIFTDTLDPDATIQTLGGHEKNLFCHANTFQSDLYEWIHKRLENHGREQENVGPDVAGMKVLAEFIAQPIELKVTLNSNIHGELEYLDQLLTGAQLQVIHSVKSKNRMVISGGAGTGKTLLAVEIAKHFSENGMKVVIATCSSPLENFLRARLSNEKAIDIKSITAFIDHQPEKANWDVIVVDEGQDVDWANWKKIESLCESTNGKLFVFMDSNQSVYRLPADLSTLLNAESHELNLNLRNTKKIAKSTELLYEGPLIFAPGPDGVTPKIIQAPNFQDAMAKCLILLNELVNNESIPASDITILSRDKKSRDEVRHELAKNGFMSCSAGEPNLGVFCVDTVPRFKGLESPIVIAICDSEWASNSEMSYVSVSRARARLFLIGNTRGTLLEKAVSAT